jgi:hypothetical protein
MSRRPSRGPAVTRTTWSRPRCLDRPRASSDSDGPDPLGSSATLARILPRSALPTARPAARCPARKLRLGTPRQATTPHAERTRPGAAASCHHGRSCHLRNPNAIKTNSGRATKAPSRHTGTLPGWQTSSPTPPRLPPREAHARQAPLGTLLGYTAGRYKSAREWPTTALAVCTSHSTNAACM